MRPLDSYFTTVRINLRIYELEIRTCEFLQRGPLSEPGGKLLEHRFIGHRRGYATADAGRENLKVQQIAGLTAVGARVIPPADRKLGSGGALSRNPGGKAGFLEPA